MLQFDLKQEAGHNLKLKYEWPQPTGEDFEMKEVETAPFKEWTLLQIEGEEPVPVEEAPVDPKPSPVKKGAAAKKDPKVEEITDNRPRLIQLKRDFAEEAGGVGMRITEPIANRFSSLQLVIHVI